ncbi:MAG: transcriptional regulator [Bacteroidia bacterium]
MSKPIKNEKQYENALERIYNLMQKDLKPNSDEADELELLSILVEVYEREHYPVEAPNPIEAIKHRMLQLGIKEKELKTMLGYKSKSNDMLTGKRKLSLTMIRKLHELLNISAEVLIAKY